MSFVVPTAERCAFPVFFPLFQPPIPLPVFSPPLPMPRKSCRTSTTYAFHDLSFLSRCAFDTTLKLIMLLAWAMSQSVDGWRCKWYSGAALFCLSFYRVRVRFLFFYEFSILFFRLLAYNEACLCLESQVIRLFLNILASSVSASVKPVA